MLRAMASLSSFLPAFFAVLLNMEPPDGYTLGCDIPCVAPVVRNTQIAFQDSTHGCDIPVHCLRPSFFKNSKFDFSTTPTSFWVRPDAIPSPRQAGEGYPNKPLLLNDPKYMRTSNASQCSYEKLFDKEVVRPDENETKTNKTWYDCVELDKETLLEPKIIGSYFSGDDWRHLKTQHCHQWPQCATDDKWKSFRPINMVFNNSFWYNSTNYTTEATTVQIFSGLSQISMQNATSVDRQAEPSRKPPTNPLPTFQTPSNPFSTTLHDDYRLPTLLNNNTTQNFTQNSLTCAENEHFLVANSHTTLLEPACSSNDDSCEACSSLLNAFDRVTFRAQHAERPQREDRQADRDFYRQPSRDQNCREPGCDRQKQTFRGLHPFLSSPS